MAPSFDGRLLAGLSALKGSGGEAPLWLLGAGKSGPGKARIGRRSEITRNELPNVFGFWGRPARQVPRPSSDRLRVVVGPSQPVN